ncbi:MAG: hypothetical protein Q9188_001089 [Gyalolechia gomerana]
MLAGSRLPDGERDTGILFLFPRNKLATNATLLQQTRCIKLVHTKEMGLLATHLAESIENLNIILMAELDHLLKQKNNVLLLRSDYSKTMTTPVLILQRVPTSHLAGFLSQVIIPIFSEPPSPVIGPPLRAPSAEFVRKTMEQERLRSLFIPPAVAEQILQFADGVDFFKRLDFMYTASGPLSQDAGDLIPKTTVLVQLYGSTETSQVPQLVPQPENWKYMEWQPTVKYEV